MAEQFVKRKWRAAFWLWAMISILQSRGGDYFEGGAEFSVCGTGNISRPGTVKELHQGMTCWRELSRRRKRDANRGIFHHAC